MIIFFFLAVKNWSLFAPLWNRTL